MLFCWLARKTHELKEFDKDFGWGAMLMLRVISTLYEKMNELYNSPSLIVEDGSMMSIFSKYIQELSPFN
jgi:hypothetical protein